MRKSSLRWPWAALIVLIMLGLAGCEQLVNLPTFTLTSAPEPTSTATAVPTATPELPAGPYPPVLLGYEPRSGQEVAAYTTPSAAVNPATIQLYFDQPMDQTSVLAAFRVTPFIEGDFKWPDDATLVFHPDALAASTRYRVTLAGGVRSAAGLPMSTELSFAFSTLAPLAVTRLSPAPGSLDARIDAPALIVFSRPIVPSSCVGQTTQVGGQCPALSLTFAPAVLGTGMWVDTSVYRFDALRGWAAGRAYTAILAADAVSVEGAVLRDPVTWSFNTAFPAIQATIPHDGQSQIPLETEIRVVFNTPMDQEITGSVFSVTGAAGEVVPGAITWEDNGAALVFTPMVRLNLGTRYTAQIGARGRAATSAPLENPQSWTFTTAPYPAFSASIPQDGVTGVDIAEPVRLVFSGALNAATLDHYITISPTVAHPYTYFDVAANVYQLSWDKLPQTEYCVLLKPGIADLYGHVITQSQSSCFVTGDLPAFISPESTASAVTLDASQPSQLNFWVQNLARVSFTLAEVSEPDFARGRDNEGVVIREWQETFDTPRNTATVVPLVLRRLGGALPAGYYRLAWDNPSWGTQSIALAVVDRHLTLKLAAEEALVWVTDLRSGEPISRTAVRLVDREGLLIAAGTTDEDGLAYIPVSLRKDLWENVAAIVGEPGETGFGVALSTWMSEVAQSAFGITLDGSASSPFVIRVSTDRTLYGPGDMVHFQGVLREDDGRYRLPPADMPIQVTVREATGYEIYSTTVALSEMGTFTGALSLPERLGVGDYVLEVSLPDASSTRVATAAFAVAIPRETVLAVSVAPESVDVMQGELLRAVIAVDGVSGIPVAGAQLTWTIHAQSEPLTALPSETWQWPAVVEDVKSAFASLLVAEGEAVTDAEGRFVLELPAEMPVFAAGQSLAPQRWTIAVTVGDGVAHDARLLPVSGQGQVTIHPSHFYLGMQPRAWVMSASKRTEINLLVRNWTQQPVVGQEVAVSLTERVWFRVPAAPSTWGYTDTVVSTVSVMTDYEGRAVAALVPPRSGAYIVTADALDADNHPVRTEIMLPASGPEVVLWPVEHGKVEPVADARVYRVGDRARILLPVAFDGPYRMLMTVERDGIFEVEQQVFDTPNPVVEIPIIEAHIPNVYVSFVLIRGVTETLSAPEVRAGYVMLKVAPTAQTLTVTAAPDKTAYRPGDTVALTVNAVDAAGRAADAIVGVALVDKASLSPEVSLPSIIDTFYGVRPLQVMIGDGLLALAGHQDATALSAEVGYRNARFGAAEALSPTPGVRFPDIVRWEGGQRTATNGEARLTFVLPDTPATWVAVVYALTADTKVGEAHVEIGAAQPLRVQPVTPRFLVVGDRAEVAAIVYNDTDRPFAGAVQLTANVGVRGDFLPQTFDLAAGGHARVAWTLSVAESSVEMLPLAFMATGGGYHDTATIELPLRRYVLPDLVGTAGVLEQAGTRLETLVIPPEAGDASALIVRVASSPVGALVDTLTYLEQYPYASTDVLIERFVSYVFTYRALQELNVADDALLARLQRSINQALERLYVRQNPDGGWGWWEGKSTMHLTALATLGLVKAERAGFAVRQTMRDQALGYIYADLALSLEGELRHPQQALGLYVLSDARIPWPTSAGAILYSARESLGVAGRAYLALALGTSDPSDSRLLVLLDGLRNEARQSAAGVHWEGTGDTLIGDGGSLHWNTDVVVTGIVVDVLARFAPDDPLLAQGVRWLMVARRGGHWQTTYETAWAIAGLSDALRVSSDLGTARPDVYREDLYYDWSIALNGTVLAEFTAQPVGSTDAIIAPWRLRAGLSPEDTGDQDPLPVLYRDHRNVLEISRSSGAGLLYYTAHLELSPPVAQIAPESRGLILRREYCAVEGDEATGGIAAPTLCRPLTELRVGEQVAVRLTLIAPQSRAYVRLEAPHPAGFVPVVTTTALSGVMTDCAFDQSARADLRGWWMTPFEHCEVLDDRVIFFASDVAPGTYQTTYVLRAVTPGTYGALPAVVSEVYFPEVWGRSAGDVIRIAP